eukprot:s5662_g2.t3
MGDCHAVEFAQQSHYNVLSSIGCSMRPDEYAAYRRPFPRSSCVELLAIDDHLTAQLCTRGELRANSELRDTEIFCGSERAYPAVGLVQHPRKQHRNVTAGTFLGADIDGVAGLVSAPRHRIGVLMRITCTIARKGCCSSELLSSLLGLWIHVLMFRRPALALLQSVFSDARRLPRSTVFQLQRESINELFSLCSVAPLLQADLRVDYPGYLFCMDASPTGAGICAASLPSDTIKELWHYSEQKGFYTKLLEPAGALLASTGFDDDPGVHFAASLGDATVAGLSFGSEPLPLRCPLRAPAFLHLFGRDLNWSSAHAASGLREVGLVEHGLSDDLRFEDLASDSVFHGLRRLLTGGVLFDLHVSAPACSLVPQSGCLPGCQSSPVCPSATDECSELDVRLARRLCFLLCLAAASGVYFSVVQPAPGFLFRLHCFRGLVAFGAVLSHVCCCDFGAPFKCPIAILHNKPWLLGLGESSAGCRGGPDAFHFPVEGFFTEASARHFESLCTPSALAVFGRHPVAGEPVHDFCRLYPCALAFRASSGSALAATGLVAPLPASASTSTLKALGFSGLDLDSLFSGDSTFEARSFHDDPEWIGELADCLEFVELLRYKFAVPGHINILECRAYKTWIKWCARRHPRCRLLGLIDSRVLLGAAAKGRSASAAICRVLKTSLPYVLGSALYPGGLHVYSAKNRADGPSRGCRPLAPSKPWPAWLRALVAGDTRPFDLVCASAAVPRRLGRWVRLLLLLAGDVERHPGPRYSGAPRGNLDLQAGFAVTTRHKMSKSLGAFTAWLQDEFGLSLEAVTTSASSVALALRAFGLFLYAGGYPRYLLVYAITSIQDLFPQFRSHLSPAWQVDRKWQLAEPGECRPVISQPILQASIALAICWGWYDWAAITAVGFLCMLHPSEMIPLVRQDLVFPTDALSPDPVAYVHIRNPKTQRFARRQHSRLEDPVVLALLSALYAELPLHARLSRLHARVPEAMERHYVSARWRRNFFYIGWRRGRESASALSLLFHDALSIMSSRLVAFAKEVRDGICSGHCSAFSSPLARRFTFEAKRFVPGSFASAGSTALLLNMSSHAAVARVLKEGVPGCTVDYLPAEEEKAQGLVGKLVEKSKDFADGAIDSMGEFVDGAQASSFTVVAYPAVLDLDPNSQIPCAENLGNWLSSVGCAVVSGRGHQVELRDAASRLRALALNGSLWQGHVMKVRDACDVELPGPAAVLPLPRRRMKLHWLRALRGLCLASKQRIFSFLGEAPVLVPHDATSIEEALDMSPAEVIIAAGTYHLAQGLRLRSRVRLLGEGATTLQLSAPLEVQSEFGAELSNLKLVAQCPRGCSADAGHRCPSCPKAVVRVLGSHLVAVGRGLVGLEGVFGCCSWGKAEVVLKRCVIRGGHHALDIRGGCGVRSRAGKQVSTLHRAEEESVSSFSFDLGSWLGRCRAQGATGVPEVEPASFRPWSGQSWKAVVQTHVRQPA